MRGCGRRTEDSLYLCVSESPLGQPLDAFLVDPAKPWTGGHFRAPIIFRDRRGVNHILIWIGATYYPYVSDYIQECKVMGVSRKVPVNYDFSRLTPGRSQLLLVHPRAIPQFNYSLLREWCPKKIEDPHRCVGDLWDLSSAKGFRRHTLHEGEGDELTVVTPSCTYEVMRAYTEDGDPLKQAKPYQAGVILRFPRFSFQFVNKQGKAPMEVRALEGQGFRLEVVEE